MAVYYKFKSAKDYDTVAIEGHFISVANLKDKIFESKHLGRGTDFDLVISNAQTNEEYLDEGTLVPKNTSVIVRRVPGRPRMTIVATEKKEEVKEAETSKAQSTPPKSSFQVNDIQYKYPDETEWDEFGTDLYALPEAPPGLQTATQSEFTSKADEDSKIKAFVDASASDWQRQTQDFPSRGFNRGVGGRNMGGRGYGRMMERKTPPQGYVCHRCKIPGHFIQHCPTNGDPNYDIKRVKPPTGIPKSMLVATPNGSYALPSGAVGVLRPNEAAFEKEVEGLPSSRSVEGFPSSRAAAEVPPELHCPLCREVMKDAVLTSRCCLKSYCDKCIRDYIISKSMCVCGKTNVLADHLLPNKTLRETINRILENSTSSQENGGSLLQVQDMESERCPRPKAPSPSVSGCAKDSNKAISKSDVPDVKETVNDQKPSVNIAPPQITEKNRALKSQEPLDVTPESVSTKEPQSQESAPVVEEEVQQKAPVGEPARKKKKKRPRQFPNNDLQWRVNQDYGADSCIMPYAAAAYNPYWAAATQWGPESYLAGPIPYMGYGTGTCVVTPEMYGAQGYMAGFVPPVNREYMDYSMNACNAGLAVMSREEFEARKADLRRKKENEQKYYGKDHTKDSVNDDDETASVKRMRLQHQASSHGHTKEERGKSSERHRELEHPPLSPRAPGKRKAEREESHVRDGWHSVDSKINSPAAVTDADINKSSTSGRLEKKQKGSVFSRISFPEHRDEDLHIRATKKRNLHESQNGFREHERQLNVNKQQHYDDAKSLKKVINGRRGPYEDDLSDNDAAFMRNNSSHHRERSHDRESEKHSDSNNRIPKHGRDHLVIKRG